jgi:hypothetical protein
MKDWILLKFFQFTLWGCNSKDVWRLYCILLSQLTILWSCLPLISNYPGDIHDVNEEIINIIVLFIHCCRTVVTIVGHPMVISSITTYMLFLAFSIWCVSFEIIVVIIKNLWLSTRSCSIPVVLFHLFYMGFIKLESKCIYYASLAFYVLSFFFISSFLS